MQSPPTVCDNVCQPSNLQRFHCLGFCEDGNCLDGKASALIDMSFQPIFLYFCISIFLNVKTGRLLPSEKCFYWFWKCFSVILRRNIFSDFGLNVIQCNIVENFFSYFFIESISVHYCKEIFCSWFLFKVFRCNIVKFFSDFGFKVFQCNVAKKYFPDLWLNLFAAFMLGSTLSELWAFNLLLFDQN